MVKEEASEALSKASAGLVNARANVTAQAQDAAAALKALRDEKAEFLHEKAEMVRRIKDEQWSKVCFVAFVAVGFSIECGNPALHVQSKPFHVSNLGAVSVCVWHIRHHFHFSDP